HGPGASGIGDKKGFADGARDIFHLGDHHVVLGDGHGDAGDIDFLKRVGAEEFAADLTGYADNGRGVEHGSGDASHHVGGAGAGSGHGHAHAARGTGVAVGHVRGALLVPDENMVQLGSAQRVVHGEDGAARIAKDVPHAQARERFAEYFRTCQLHSVLPEETGAASSAKLAGAVGMAPSEEEETSAAYLAKTPWV